MVILSSSVKALQPLFNLLTNNSAMIPCPTYMFVIPGKIFIKLEYLVTTAYSERKSGTFLLL